MLIAIAPIVPLFLLLAAGGGLFAFLRKRRGGTPPDPGQVAAAPFFNLQSGTTSAMLERSGPGWAWSVAGPVQNAGSDTDPAKALLAMAQALAESEGGAAITGEAGGPDDATLELAVEPDADEWDWIITEASKLPAAVPGTPAPPITLESGSQDTRSTALLRALAAASRHLAWVTLATPGLDSGGAPVQPDPTFPGLKVVGNTLVVTSLPAWVAYEAPHMREAIDTTLTADEILDAELAGGADLPASTTLSGKPIALVRARFADALEKVRAGTYQGISEPADELAALLVGATAPPGDSWVGEYHGHTLLVRQVRKPSGAIALPGAPPAGPRYEWLAWVGSMRGYDADAVATHVMLPNRSRAQTIRYARQQVDQKFPQPGDGEDGTGHDATVNPDWNKPADPVILDFIPGVFTPPADMTYMPGPVTVKLPLTKWTQTSVKEIEVFDFAEDDHHKRKNWRIVIGVCIDPEGANPYGELSDVANGNVSLDGPWASLEGYANAYARIRNLPAAGGIGGEGGYIDIRDFKSPQTLKVQLDASFVRGPVITWSKPIADITGSGDGEQVDPCPDRPALWPIADRDNSFHVWIKGVAAPKVWKPRPRFMLVWKGTKLYLRVTYSGVPVFGADDDGIIYANPSAEPRLTMHLQVWAAGTNS